MTNKLTLVLARCAIIVIALCGLTVCAIWYPCSFSLIKIGLINTKLTVLTTAQSVVLLAFYLVASLPCFIILILGWGISASIKTERLFTSKISKTIKTCAKILLVDLCAFFIGNVILLLLKINDFAIIYFFLIIGGFILSAFLLVLSHYVAKAAELQEISDGTIW